VEPLPQLSAEQISELMSSDEALQVQITQLEEQLSRMKPNLAAIAEYRKKVSIIIIIIIIIIIFFFFIYPR